jgi:hypothetical protein
MDRRCGSSDGVPGLWAWSLKFKFQSNQIKKKIIEIFKNWTKDLNTVLGEEVQLSNSTWKKAQCHSLAIGKCKSNPQKETASHPLGRVESKACVTGSHARGGEDVSDGTHPIAARVEHGAATSEMVQQFSKCETQSYCTTQQMCF